MSTGKSQVNLSEAAEQLGVHYQTAYRWVRNGSLSAVKRPGTGYEIDATELARFARARATPTPPPERLIVRDWDGHVSRLLNSLVQGDELAARAIVQRLADGSVSVLEQCEHLLAPCMAEIGSRWHSGELSVAIEHRATAICERILASISPHPAGRPRGTVVVTTLDGDLHALPATMAALALREDRWKVHYLGVSVPPDDVVAIVEDVDADLVVFTVSTIDLTDDGSRLVATLNSAGRRTLVGRPGGKLSSLIEMARSS